MAENSRMERSWIERVWADNPCQLLDNGNIMIGPSRLSFANLLERSKKKNGTEGPYGAVILLPELGGPVKIDPLLQAVQALYKEHMPAALANKAVRDKLHNPFKQQGDQIDMKTGEPYAGYVAGRICISANSSQSQPGVVDVNGAPITDKRRVYSGAWAIVSVRPAWFSVDGNQGPTFYLQNVMVVADDDSLGGVGGSNPSQDFAGVKIDATVNPVDMFSSGGASSDTSVADLLG